MSTEAGKVLSSTVGNDLNGLPSLDPFADLNPLLPESMAFSENISLTLFPIELECFRNKLKTKKMRMGWGEDDGNAFDAFQQEVAFIYVYLILNA